MNPGYPAQMKGEAMKRLVQVMIAAYCCSAAGAVWAMHPLITDDAGTQGKGRFQIELNGSFGSDRATAVGTTVTERESELIGNLTIGAGENVDIFLEVPHAWRRISINNGSPLDAGNGPADASIGAKWRFFEKDGFGLAVKPALTLPTGDENRGFGAGRAGGSLFLIAAKESEPWGVFLNLGYIRNENLAGESKNLWHASLAVTLEVAEHLKIAANAGIEKNPDPAASDDPAFGLAGVIYSIGKDLDLDAGMKFGLNDPETDRTYLAGVTVRF